MIDFKVCVCVCVSYSGFPLAWHVSSRFSPSLVRPWGNSTTIFTSGLSERIKERELFNGTAGKTRIGLSSLLVWSRHRASSDSCHGCTIQERGSRISWFKEIHEMHVQRRTGLVNRFHLAPGFPNMAPTQPRRSSKNPRVENCFPGCSSYMRGWWIGSTNCFSGYQLTRLIHAYSYSTYISTAFTHYYSADMLISAPSAVQCCCCRLSLSDFTG